MHRFERRGMDRVAAKIAQEIACFSRTSVSTPRGSSSPSIIPAGPPPTMQQRQRLFSGLVHRPPSM